MAKRQYYVEGNTARQLQVVPSPEHRREHREAERKNRRKQRKLERVLAFDLKYTMILLVALGIMGYACGTMLSVQAQLQAQKQQMAELTATYENLQNDNDAKTARIGSNVDLNHIYKIATEELGMVYPHAGQVVTYDSANEQYVKQYQDVPDLD